MKGRFITTIMTDFINEATKYNANFYKWFGDSKIVTKYSKPLVVYHGSGRTFDEFTAYKASVDFPEAIYFSSNKKTAESYSNRNTPVYKVLLKMETPYIVDAGNRTFNDYYDYMVSKMWDAKDNGYDGLILRNIIDDSIQKGGYRKATTYIVFNPNQVKSVNNDGSWDIDDDNIYS